MTARVATFPLLDLLEQTPSNTSAQSLTAPEPLAPAAPAPIEFVRMPRARRYILRLRPDGSLRVTIPRRGSLREARAFVARQQRWIERQRVRVVAAHAPVTWGHGSAVWLRGERVPLAVMRDDERVTIAYAGRTIAARSQDDIRVVVERDLRRIAKGELEPRLRQLAAEHRLAPMRVSIRNQRSRWGSCARNGNIALNFRLVQMPPWIRDYVLLHELMHLREPNHGRRFWRLVAQACPAFRAAEQWLKSEGRALF